MSTPTAPQSTTTTTMTAAASASIYQQLKGHLTELKLADAAEALPRVLDQAQAEGWSLTQTLEHLLAVEVTATDARRLAGRFRFANLPTGATLTDFDLDAASGIDRSLLAELATCRYLETATNVLLIGPPGVGKTHIARALAMRQFRPATAPTSPPPPTSPPAAIGLRSRGSGAR